MDYHILLIGNGAREHIIGETLKKSVKHNVKLTVIGKSVNPGLKSIADEYITGDYMNHEFVMSSISDSKIDFCIIGPDDPIGDGLADSLLKIGIRSVAPLKSVAQLESSKSFTRELLRKYNIPGNPQFCVLKNLDSVQEFIEKCSGQFVVKYDGLKGGKGVKVIGDHFQTVQEGLDYAKECIEEAGKVVIEEKFIGQEFSLMSFSDGMHLAHMPAVRDYKRAYDFDKGPNTGGMGTYSDANHSLPFLTQKDIDDAKQITKLVQNALHQETGTYFKGIMYGGFIAVKDGVRLIEYNARFGDPEVMNVLTLLESDFVEICLAILNCTLDKQVVSFKREATVCKYIVPNGYPDAPKKGEIIEIVGEPTDAKMYYGSVNATSKGIELGSSRALAFVGSGATLEDALEHVNQATANVHGPVFFRHDIGTYESLGCHISQMNILRN